MNSLHVIDDQDYELLASGDGISTLIRDADGTDVAFELSVLTPGDRVGDHQALAVLGFGFGTQLQPNHTRLEWVHLRFWVEPGEGDVAEFGPLIVSHIPNAEDLLDGTGELPHPPGTDVATVANTPNSGWREVDVSSAFFQDWHAGQTVSAFAVRFATPSDGDGGDDFVDLDPVVVGKVQRAHLVLHFGVDL